MNLQVQILEARDLPARDSNGLSDPYVRLQLGSLKFQTSVVHKNLNPKWHEEFFFRVEDSKEELILTLWDKDRFTDDFLGQLKIPVERVLEADKQRLPASWYTLQKRHFSKTPVSGELLMGLFLYGKHCTPLSSIHSEERSVATSIGSHTSIDTRSIDTTVVTAEDGSLNLEQPSQAKKVGFDDSLSLQGDPSDKASTPHQSLANKISHFFFKGAESSPQVEDALRAPFEDSTQTTASLATNDAEDEIVADSFFNDDEAVSLRASGDSLPAPLSGGILLDCSYAVNLKALNALLFKPGCQFYRDFFSLQKTTDIEEGPWKKSGEGSLRRVVTYTKAATKLVKAVKATEEQTYIMADKAGFAVLESVSTPDVPFGNNFRTELLFTMTPQSDLPRGEEGTRLTISWRMNFKQSTMMKSMIENGARQGLKDSYQQFAELLPTFVNPIDDKKKAQVPELVKPKSDWELVFEYFGNLTVVSTLVMLVFVLLHVILAKPSGKGGLEFWGIDMADSLGELITTAILVLQVERLIKMTHHFFNARYRRGCDHGVKAIGDGWLLSVTLVEGLCLAPVDSSRTSDPYVVFTCSGKTRTSSVKLQTLNPQWQEFFEFDATEDPPSTMEVEVFDFEGPFAEAVSLGYTEINFLKYSSEELADLWLPLDGNLARSFGSRLHLRVFLKNSKEHDTVTQYIAKMEKEVGTKILRRSPERNSSFQKLFSLPAEEFLIDDFACSIKRKVPLQGRLFLSPRMLGFYSNIFGRKTKFAFLWEEIEEIKEVSAPLLTMGNLFNPSLLLFVRKGRGSDAISYARKTDAKGRLHFQFQSFVKFGPAYRMSIGLWKIRSLTPEKRMELVENNELGEGTLSSTARQGDDLETFLGVEEANMTEVYFMKLSFNVESIMLLFEKDKLDEKIMEKAGCLSYRSTPWESVDLKPGVQQRQQNFKLSQSLCRFATEVTCIQQKTVSEDKRLCVVDELLTLQDVPFGDNFQLQIRKEVENVPTDPTCCTCRVSVGIAWRKSSRFQKRITKNIYEKFKRLLKEHIDLAIKEVVRANGLSTHVFV